MRILLVGDTHANTDFFNTEVLAAVEAVGAGVVCVVGDFGYWGEDSFLEHVRAAPVPVWFIDGNHENHPLLRADISVALDEQPGILPVPLGGSLYHLPRGSRLELEGVRVAFCGGAVSIDRAFRTPGVDFFFEESCGDEELEALGGGGRAEILISHDAPAGWTVPGLPPMEALPAAWRAQLPACWEHRQRLADALMPVAPELVVHGHYHSRYSRLVDAPWGPVRVEGLDCDGTGRRALAVLSVSDGSWALTGVE